MARPRTTTGRRWVVLVAVLALVALAPAPMVTAQPAAPDGIDTDAITVQALGAQKLVFKATVDASKQDAPRLAAKMYKAQTSGRHVFKLTWPGDAHLKLFIYDSDGNRIAAKGNTTQPKKLGVVLEAGEKYKIKVKAATGKATFKLFARAPMWTPGDFFDDLPSWGDVNDELATKDTLVGTTPWEQNDDDPRYMCSSERRNLQNSADEIVTFGARSGWLWPGVLVQGATYERGVDAIAELPIRQRAPATVFLDIAREDIRREVVNPTPSRLASAVGDLIEEAENAGHEPGTSVIFTKTATHSSEQFALHLGLSAKYLKSWMKASLDMSRELTENTVTVYFKEVAFTANLEQPETPGGFFSNELTEALLQRQIDLGRLDRGDNLPIYVSSVTYGRVFMFSVTSTESVSEIIAAIEGVYDGGAFEAGAEARMRFREIVSLENTEMVTFGGSSEAASRAITTGDFREYFTVDPALTQYKPIAYTLQDLGSSRTFVGDVTDYEVVDCKPLRTGEIRVSFAGAELVDYDDDDWWSGYELKAFFFEAQAVNEDGTPVVDPPQTCGMWDVVEGLVDVGCWNLPGDNYQTIRSGEVWRPDVADDWWVDLQYDFDGNLNDPEYLANAELTLRAGFLDEDGFLGDDDWTRGWSETLVGDEIWTDNLDDDPATHVFDINNGGAWWRVFVTVEVDPID